MTKLRETIRYICKHYPHQSELSNARLTKMVYLADWEFARQYGRQITEVEWYFNNYGPYVDDVLREAHRDNYIDVIPTTSVYGTPKILMQMSSEIIEINLRKKEMKCIDQVMDTTKTMYWNSFIKHVYATYPIKTNDRYSKLDLICLATDEKSLAPRNRNLTKH